MEKHPPTSLATAEVGSAPHESDSKDPPERSSPSSNGQKRWLKIVTTARFKLKLRRLDVHLYLLLSSHIRLFTGPKCHRDTPSSPTGRPLSYRLPRLCWDPGPQRERLRAHILSLAASGSRRGRRAPPPGLRARRRRLHVWVCVRASPMCGVFAHWDVIAGRRWLMDAGRVRLPYCAATPVRRPRPPPRSRI